MRRAKTDNYVAARLRECGHPVEWSMTGVGVKVVVFLCSNNLLTYGIHPGGVVPVSTATTTSRIAAAQTWRFCVQVISSDSHSRFHRLMP